MILDYIYADAKRQKIKLDGEVETTSKWQYLQSANKLEFIKSFVPRYLNAQKIVLFDSNHTQLLNFYNNNDINEMQNIQNIDKDSRILFFTSGSSGFPVGAFKTEKNLSLEVESLRKVVSSHNIKRVVVSVPFVHIYGILAGLLLPMSFGDIELVVKEDFLPYELLEEAKKGDTLVVTTPVFIKALAKLPSDENLSKTLFISSTAPLCMQDVDEFQKKYNTSVVQLFGSTETGGIAYKRGTESIWHPLDGVLVRSDDEKLSVSSEFISKYLINKGIVELKQPYTTEDIIKTDADGGFELVGRSNKIIKIAGKRISALQIENILKEIEGVREAVVELVYKKELLRSEQIVITLEADIKIDKKTIKEKIAQSYGIITIPFRLQYVDKINYSAMGKKVIFK